MRTALALVPTKVLILSCCLSSLKKQLNLPAFLVNGGEGGSGQFQSYWSTVSNALLLVPPTQTVTKRKSTQSGRPATKGCKRMISSLQDVAVLGHGSGLHTGNICVGFEPGNEKHPGPRPPGEEMVIGCSRGPGPRCFPLGNQGFAPL